MLEWLIPTLLSETLRTWLSKRKPKNNRKAIAQMERVMPTFETVGELRELLNNFSDDVLMIGSSFQYPMLQIRIIDNIGRIYIGSSSCRSEE